MQARFGKDGDIVQKTEPVPAENWRKEAEGQFISFKETQKHVITFLEEIPTKCVVEFSGREKTAYRWPVTEDDVERMLSVTSYRLLQKLKDFKKLQGKTLELEYLPMKMDYKVREVEQKK